MSISTLSLIEAFSNANGVSGFEEEVHEVAKEYAKDFADFQKNSILDLFIHPTYNKGNRPVIMLDGHCDEVGFMVQGIRENGTLSFLTLGSMIENNLPAAKVRIRNRDGVYYTGVIASKPPHFLSEAEKKSTLSVSQMVIDIGASSKKEVVEDFKIEIGAPVVPDVLFSYNPLNQTVLGKGFDCRLGCAAVVKTLEQLQGQNLSVDVVGSLSAQEEIGSRGAQISAQTIQPDIAIVFEGTPADDTFPSPFDPQAALKKGPQVRHIDRCMITNPRFLKFSRLLAQELDIPFQDAVRTGGGTDGGPIHVSNRGVPTIVIGIPVRYIHTHYGFAAIEDFEQSVRWATEIVKRLDEKLIESF